MNLGDGDTYRFNDLWGSRCVWRPQGCKGLERRDLPERVLPCGIFYRLWLKAAKEAPWGDVFESPDDHAIVLASERTARESYLYLEGLGARRDGLEELVLEDI
jgi:hypothetical protein